MKLVRSVVLHLFLTVQRFSFLCRCTLLFGASMVMIATLLAPASLNAQVAVATDGLIEDAVTIGMVALIAIGWLDAFVNDLLPSRFYMTWARERRHVIFAFLAGLYLVRALGTLDTAVPGAWVITLNHMGWAGFCVAYTFAAALRPDHAL